MGRVDKMIANLSVKFISSLVEFQIFKKAKFSINQYLLIIDLHIIY